MRPGGETHPLLVGVSQHSGRWHRRLGYIWRRLQPKGVWNTDIRQQSLKAKHDQEVTALNGRIDVTAEIADENCEAYDDYFDDVEMRLDALEGASKAPEWSWRDGRWQKGNSSSSSGVQRPARRRRHR